MTEAIDQFRIRVDDSVLEDLRDRLARTRFPDEIAGTGWEYGIPSDYLRELVEYWRDEYVWRVHEARLNLFLPANRLKPRLKQLRPQQNRSVHVILRCKQQELA